MWASTSGGARCSRTSCFCAASVSASVAPVRPPPAIRTYMLRPPRRTSRAPQRVGRRRGWRSRAARRRPRARRSGCGSAARPPRVRLTGAHSTPATQLRRACGRARPRAPPARRPPPRRCPAESTGRSRAALEQLLDALRAPGGRAHHLQAHRLVQRPPARVVVARRRRSARCTRCAPRAPTTALTASELVTAASPSACSMPARSSTPSASASASIVRPR